MAESNSSSTTDTTLPLLHAAKRTLNLPQIPPYATDLVRNIVREVRERDATVNAILSEHPRFNGSGFNPSEDPPTACRLLVEHLSMRRGKRCLLAYHLARVGKLEKAIWEGREEDLLSEADSADKRGGNATAASESGTNHLSPEEEDYVRQYAELLAMYKGQWTDVDLTGSMEPPRDLFVDVRVLKDAGEIQTEYGSINLTKNSQFYVRQGDVERLISQGYLQRLD